MKMIKNIAMIIAICGLGYLFVNAFIGILMICYSVVVFILNQRGFFGDDER